MTLNWPIKDFLERLQAKFQSFGDRDWMIGISGGIDSAVVLAILTHIMPKERIHPFYISFWDEDQHLIDLLQEKLAIKIERVDLRHSFHALQADLHEKRAQYTNNWLPKLRSLFLYDQALKNNGLVLSCLNYSEYYLGYFTKFGDGQGDFFPISGLLKSQVYKLANYFGLPQEIVQQQPSPGFPGITDEGELGFSYPEFERFLAGEKVAPEIQQKITEWHRRNAHKRGTIPCLPREDF